ncbi:hypothetical protein Q1695_009997 [Nippostrongylus brasiliensis]|nr:hypothetical protein Q1695_009997 [Nippostrongylus brasiliensis]
MPTGGATAQTTAVLIGCLFCCWKISLLVVRSDQIARGLTQRVNDEVKVLSSGTSGSTDAVQVGTSHVAAAAPVSRYTCAYPITKCCQIEHLSDSLANGQINTPTPVVSSLSSS